MAFGAVIGMNLFFIIMPFLNTISFFNVAFLDNLMNVVIMLAALTMVKNFIATLSGFIGASDANKVGESTKGEVGKLAQKAGGTTLKAASLGVKAFKATGGNNLLRYAGKGVGLLAGKIGNKINNSEWGKKRAADKQAEQEKEAKISEAVKSGNKDEAIALLGGGKKAERQYNKILKKQTKEKEAEEVANYRQEMAGAKTDEERRAIADKYGKDVVKRASGGAAKTFFAVATSTLFGGGKIERDIDGNIDAGKTFKAAGGAVLDVGSAAIKFEFGDLLQGNGLLKTLRSKESGVGDAFRGLTAAVFAGPDGKVAKDSIGGKILASKPMETEKSKEDSQKDAAGQESAAIGDTATNTKAMLQAIQTLINKIES